jgi:protein SCO1/2
MKFALVSTIVIAGILAGVAAARYFMHEPGTAPSLERATLFQESRPLPELTLIDQAGRAFGRERLRGHWTFLFFGFVNCPDICPTTLATLAAVRKELAGLPAGERPGVMLVSVDPGRDSPAALARYVAHFDPSFTGVTGDADAISSLTESLGVAVIMGPEAEDGSYSVDHSAAIFLVDPEARVTAVFGTPHRATTIASDYRRIVAAH